MRDEEKGDDGESQSYYTALCKSQIKVALILVLVSVITLRFRSILGVMIVRMNRRFFGSWQYDGNIYGVVFMNNRWYYGYGGI